MMDLKKHLVTRGCTVLKQFRTTEDRCICLVRRPDGSNAVWRFYNRPVLAYKTLHSVKCPELPEVYNYTEIESGCLVEEEYIDGISLAYLIESHRLDEYQTAAIAHQVCNALTVLHHKNMVHRDIKPENILITSDGRVVLIDLDAVSPRTSTKDRDTQLLGTVGYAAPEQYGFGHSDGRTDIFGMGVLMNVLLTGKHPVQELTNGVLRPIIEKCIAVNVDQRFATVEELIAQLPRYTTKRCPSCSFVSPGGGCIFCGIHTKKAHKSRRPHLRLAAVALAFLLFAGIGCLIWFAQHPEQDKHSASAPSPGHTEQISENTPAPSPSAVIDKSDTPKNSPATPSLSPDNLPTVPSDPPDTSPPVISPDTSSFPVNPPDVSPDVIFPDTSPSSPVSPPDTSPPAPKEPSTVEPPDEKEPTPSQLPPLSVESLPDFPGEPTYEITSFLYDLDGDGTEEEYYFGLMAEPALFAPKLVLTTPYTEGSVSTRNFAPAVFTMNEAGTLVPVTPFAPMLEEIEISFYQYKGNNTLPAIREVNPLGGVWRGAMELSCGYEDTGNWIAVTRAVLNGTELISHSNFVIRVSNTIPSTQVQPLLLTDGLPVGEPIAISYSSQNELLLGKCEFYGCTAQYLDNEHLRFAVDYSGPVAQSLTVFNPPDGALFKYTDRSGTSGTRELLIFDLPMEQLHAVRMFTITFNCGNGSRFLLFANTAGL